MQPSGGQMYTRLHFIERFDIQYQNSSCPYDSVMLLDKEGKCGIIYER